MPSTRGLNLTKLTSWLLRGCGLGCGWLTALMCACAVVSFNSRAGFAQTATEVHSNRRVLATIVVDQETLLESEQTTDQDAKQQSESTVEQPEPSPIVLPEPSPIVLPEPSPIERPPFEPEETSPESSTSLAWFLQLAVENHPALDVASADVVAANYEAFQAGLPPNPRLGVFADEVGNDESAGLIGVYLQRQIVRGGKLELARQVKCREAAVLTQAQRQQLQRIETDVRTEFYRLLVAQRRVELTSQLWDLQADALSTAKLLFDASETPKTDLLQTQVQSGRVELKLQQARIAATNAWRRLATAVSFPDLPTCSVNGSLNEITDPIDFREMLQVVLATSPQREEAVVGIDLAKARLQRQLAQTIPNYQTQLTVGQDTATDDVFAGFQLQVPLMVSDRNQGNIAAARARIARAESQLAKVELLIARRLTNQFQNYEFANAQVEMYDANLIPKARESLEIVSIGYRAGEVDFLQVLAAQQSLLDLTLEYLNALEKLWNARQQITGLALSDPLTN